MKIIQKEFNLIPNCKKFKLGSRYDTPNAYNAMGFNTSIANFEVKFKVENKTYILNKFLQVIGDIKIEVFDSKYTQRKCEELELDVIEFEEKINKQKAKQKDIKLLSKLEHKDCIEIIKSAQFETKIYLKQLNSDDNFEVIDYNINKLSKINFDTVEEFYEFYNDNKMIKEYLKNIF